MATIIDLLGTESNAGEARFVQVLEEHLDERHIVYRNRSVNGRELDVCMLVPEVGLLVVEVKGWLQETVNQVLDGHRILINVRDGTVEQAPLRQAKGYRYALESRIRNELGVAPLAFEMVCYPFISREFYLSKGLNLVSEEAFTFLSDDLASGEALRAKLQAAIALTQSWSRDAFSPQMMLRVRGLFEGQSVPPAETETELQKTMQMAARWLVPVYSRLCFIDDNESTGSQQVDTLLELYARGTRIFLITPDRNLLAYAAQKVNELLAHKGLRRDRDHLFAEITAGATTEALPLNHDGFRCFNFQASLIDQPNRLHGIRSFTLDDGVGCWQEPMKSVLKRLHTICSFNCDQYAVEHARPDKGVVVRAGAGTGKTHVMISRILFLCYNDGITGASVRKRLQMITFTNDAADNMKTRLKDCFKDYYLLTGLPEFLELVGQVDNMQISTIHAFARSLIEYTGSKVGFGRDIVITSAVQSRRDVLSKVLEAYLDEKLAQDRNYLTRLNMPIYMLREQLEHFATQLSNKSADIAALRMEQFGRPEAGERNAMFHELVGTVLPLAEQRYQAKLLKDNRMHLMTMMSNLNKAVTLGASRLQELRDTAPQYLFIDEFQDTDDVQIATLLELARIMDYRLFVVGDIKQCIYRFRGAEEKAFDQLRIEQSPGGWQCFELTKNYRTDERLLAAYQEVFRRWDGDALLEYKQRDTLTSSILLNANESPNVYFRRLPTASSDGTFPVLFEEVDRCVSKLHLLIDGGAKLSVAERTVAILVRENWQANEVRKAGVKHGYANIRTHTGGDLYQSPPALELLTLVMALLNNRQPEQLYALLTSSYFGMPLNRLSLWEIGHRSADAGQTVAERQAALLTATIDDALRRLGNQDEAGWSWSDLMFRLRTQPILQVLRQLINLLRPWERYSQDDWSRRFYRMNLDLVLEQIIESVTIDSLSIHSLASFLQMCVVTHRQVDCRWPDASEDDITVACYTVHKAKGLEYGFVVLPYASFNIAKAKTNKLEVTYSFGRVGYRYNSPEAGQLANDQYDQARETEDRKREETRVLYVAMTRAIRSFSWLDVQDRTASPSWQVLLGGGQ